MRWKYLPLTLAFPLRGQRHRSAVGSMVADMNLLHRTSWRFWTYLLAAIPICFLDITWFTGCRCWYGAWENYQVAAALLVVGLVGMRFAGAWLFAEQNSGWKYYVAVLIASPFLVRAAFAIAKLALPADLQVHPGGGE
jgi:hypothetical protein